MGRTPCCTKDGVNKGAWTAEEDRILKDYINTHGEGKWRRLPEEAGLKRCGKSCRLRWLNYLRPGIKRGNITSDEEDLIIRLHKLLGNRWSLIAGRLPGRTDNEIKNYWNTNLSKRVPGGKQKSGTKSESSQDQFVVVQKARTAPASPSAAASESSDGLFSRCSLVFIGETASESDGPSILFGSGMSEYPVPGSVEFGNEFNACVPVENSHCGPVVFPLEDEEEINKWVDTELGSLDAFLETEDWIFYT